ncbi:hypothetical protein HYPSUDRAFT_212722 [Hypholoma sublateritium FD-334 SS-4]|uniref:Monopolin complex subunit Csm1/Pcs1 C-terminal domain-containing protein n=1 Tax=Hypholoma sublateritium (strain FD-334 SS-4) TaxID=945553 RepID=A0A0D2P7U3_HYPSF|nr:hypothetical protein HYPSUDRAFT_212722 [Hypholoma sublateritium FD-334 SS-4]
MSGADSDLGGFNSPVATKARAVTAGASKPSSSRAQAGPSRPAGGGTTNPARRKAITVDGSGDEDIQPPAKKGRVVRSRKPQQREEDLAEDEGDGVVEVDGDDIEEIEPAQPKLVARGGSKKPSPSTSKALVNGKGNAANGTLPSGATKGKSKARAKPPSKTRGQSEDEMEVEVVELADDQMEAEPEEGTARINQRTAVRGTKNGRVPPQISTGHDELVRLQEQLARANEHISDLTRQLTEIFQVRRTEPEQLLERMEAQHQSQARAQDNLIEELKVKLAQSDPLLRSGKTAVFELLTREEANKETEKLQNQLSTYREALHDREKQIKEKDDTIATLEQEKKDLKLELQLEIERGKNLASKSQRQPTSVTRPAAGFLSAHQDPKHSQAIKFYEDLTNLIIPNIRMQPGRFLDIPEWILNCCYTYNDVTDKEAGSKSLQFGIRLCHDLKSGESEPVERIEQLVDSVHYTPKDLDKETAEFVESLGFLNDAFTFERNQLSLFLRTLYDNISGEENDTNSKGDIEESEGSVVLLG